jgi:hypothetical protein
MLQLVLATALVPNLAPINDPAPDKLPGPAPAISAARVEKDDLVVLETAVVPVTREVVVEISDGMVVRKEKRLLTEYVTETRMVKHPVKDVQAYAADGKKLDAKALAGRLKRLTPVLLSRGGKIDPFYLRMLKDDGIALVVPVPKEKPTPAPQPVPPVERKPGQ